MKNIIAYLSILFCCLQINLSAQVITEVEYFFDTDPGIGNGILIDIEDNTTIDQDFNIPLDGISFGVHNLFFRTKDDSDQWSLAQYKQILVLNGTNENTLSTLEYFFDADPGFGNGNQISLGNVTTLDQDFTFDLSTIDLGVHLLYLRIQNSNGTWSHTQKHQFIVFPGTNEGQDLIQMEYYFDEDPGFGNGIQLDLNSNQVDTNFTVIVPETMSQGWHTLNVRVKDGLGKWSHYTTSEFVACPTGPATAGFQPVRFGNTISFVDTSKNVLDYFWDFDDGTTSTLSNPLHEFVFGEYTITQIVDNGCNTDTATYYVEIKGVEDYSPKSAGSGGDIAITFFGGGLSLDTKTSLVGNSQTILSERITNESSTQLTGLFDLHEATPGVYDVVVEIEGIDPVTFHNGFTIEEKIAPILSTEILAPLFWRNGIWVNANIVVKNEGNVLANGVHIVVGFPENVETTIRDIFHESLDVVTWINDSLGETTIDRGSLSEIYDEFEYYEIDSFLGEPYVGKAYQIYVPFVPANEDVFIPIKMRGTSLGFQDLRSYSFTVPYFGSPMSKPAYEYVHAAGMTAAAAAAQVPGVDPYSSALRFTGKNIGYVDVGSKVAFTEFFDWYYGVNNADADFYKNQSADLAMSVVGSAVDHYGGLSSAALASNKESARFFGKQAIKHGKDLSLPIHYLNKNKAVFEELLLKTDALERANFLWSIGGDALTIYGLNNEYTSLFANPDRDHSSLINVITSRDPNAIYGPYGVGEEQYINEADRLGYTITFENVDTATAPAQIVKLENYIDPTKYDLSTFYLGDFTIADESFTVPNGRQEFTMDVDLRPRLDIITRVSAWLNTETSTIHWTFISLDPLTGDLVENPLDGFLPPNVNFPEGEGSVSYSVKLKDQLANNSRIENSANIIFDDNEAIVTNVWFNTLDIEEPTSQIELNYTVTNDTIMNLNWSGLDNQSGINNYSIYVSENGGDFFFAQSTSNTSGKYIGKIGDTYGFYVVSGDKVGNKESKDDADITVSLTPTSTNNNLLASESIEVFPNPNNGNFSVDFNLEQSQLIHIQLVDIQGKVHFNDVFHYQKDSRKFPVELNDLSKGIYSLKIMASSGALLLSDKVVIQ